MKKMRSQTYTTTFLCLLSAFPLPILSGPIRKHIREELPPSSSRRTDIHHPTTIHETGPGSNSDSQLLKRASGTDRHQEEWIDGVLVRRATLPVPKGITINSGAGGKLVLTLTLPDDDPAKVEVVTRTVDIPPEPASETPGGGEEEEEEEEEEQEGETSSSSTSSSTTTTQETTTPAPAAPDRPAPLPPRTSPVSASGVVPGFEKGPNGEIPTTVLTVIPIGEEETPPPLAPTETETAPESTETNTAAPAPDAGVNPNPLPVPAPVTITVTETTTIISVEPAPTDLPVEEAPVEENQPAGTTITEEVVVTETSTCFESSTVENILTAETILPTPTTFETRFRTTTTARRPSEAELGDDDDDEEDLVTTIVVTTDATRTKTAEATITDSFGDDVDEDDEEDSVTTILVTTDTTRTRTVEATVIDDEEEDEATSTSTPELVLITVDVTSTGVTLTRFVEATITKDAAAVPLKTASATTTGKPNGSLKDTFEEEEDDDDETTSTTSTSITTTKTSTSRTRTRSFTIPTITSPYLSEEEIRDLFTPGSDSDDEEDDPLLKDTPTIITTTLTDLNLEPTQLVSPGEIEKFRAKKEDKPETVTVKSLGPVKVIKLKSISLQLVAVNTQDGEPKPTGNFQEFKDDVVETTSTSEVNETGTRITAEAEAEETG